MKRRYLAPTIAFVVTCVISCSNLPPPQTFEAPAHPIPFAVVQRALEVPIITDRRPLDLKLTKSIREFATTTLLIADDYLTPAPTAIVASKLLEIDPNFPLTNSVSLRIFLISVWGRSPEVPNYLRVTVFGRNAFLSFVVPVPTMTDAVKLVPPPPSGYSADLLSVTIDGDVNGVEFSAKESVRLSGVATQEEIRSLTEHVAADAANKILDIAYKRRHDT